MAALAGCASPATVTGMVSHQLPSMPMQTKALENNVAMDQVVGGESTNPMWLSEVGTQAFKQALVQSLQVSHLYGDLSHSHYHLNASLLELKKPFIGLNLTDTCKVHYQLINATTHKTVFDKDITNQYTAKFSDALLAVERLRLANEGAVRTNIQELISDLYALKLK